MIDINDQWVGRVGEYLVCADLIMKGHMAFVAEQGLPYDVIVDSGGQLIKIQVKTTRSPKTRPSAKDWTPAYLFNIRRMGKGGRRAYTNKEVDIFALVALDTRTIGYIAEVDAKQTMIFRLRDYAGHYLDERCLQRRKEIVQMRDGGMSFGNIAKELDMDTAQVWREATGGRTQQHAGRYLDESLFEDALNVYRQSRATSL